MVAGSPANATVLPDLASRLQQAGVVGVLRAPSAEAAVKGALASIRGGLHAIELTFTTPGVTEALQQLRQVLPEHVLLGAGTVLDAQQARKAIASGAAFLVSPHLGDDVLSVALDAGVPYLPGVLTPTEILRACRLGVQIVKLFPVGSMGGAKYLKDLFGPFPDLQLMVTGGIQPAEVGTYRSAGALAVGLGSNLYPKAALENGDWAQVEAATSRALHEAGVRA